MAKIALALTFIVAAMGCLMNKLMEIWGLSSLGYVPLALYLPAGVLGIRSWLKTRTFARSLPVVLCVLLVWLGMLYWGIEILKRDLFFVGWMTIALPVAALIVERRCWWFCAKVHVLASVAAVAVMVWLACRASGFTFSGPFRLGLLLSDDGKQLMTGVNEVGAQLAFSAILAFVLYLRAQRRAAERFSLAWGLILSVACVLTASRGAFVAWLAGTGLLLVWGTRSLPTSKVRDLVVLGTLGLLAGLFVATSTGKIVGGTLYERMAGRESETLTTLGGRIPIWKNAVGAWLADPMAAVRGVGAARADQIVARNDPFAWTDLYGNRHRSCHNTLLHWMLSFGVVGMIPAVCMIAGACRESWRLDNRDRAINRTAILACTGLLAMMGVLYARSFWLAAASLTLAMLSDDPAAVPASGVRAERSSR